MASLRRAGVQGLRGFLLGLCGTAAMTATLALEQRLRPGTRGPVDYDASGHVVTAASTALRWSPRTRGERTALFLVVHWGYGSAVAVGYQVARGHLARRSSAVVAFYAGCQAMAFTLFPVLGGTPPPWRWHRDVLCSSLAQHAVYVGTVAAADRALPGR